MSGRYRTPEAFRAALESRARKEASRGRRTLQRVLHTYVMHRFLARAVVALGERMTVKGGMALELRLDRARATKDVDLRLDGGRDACVAQLHRVIDVDEAPDYLRFTLESHPDHPEIDGDGVVHEGVRFRAQAHLAGKKYGPSFGVDIAVGDPMTGPPDRRQAPNLLDIIDMLPDEIPLYPIGTHVAEKLHAYTLPRQRTNGRIKDLLDIALIAAELSLDGATLRSAIETTFGFRRSHALPGALPPPPAEWTARYPRERDVHGLPWSSIDEVHGEAARFIDPVLAGGGGVWEPAARAWSGDGAATGGA